MILIQKLHILELTVVMVLLRKVFKQFSPLSKYESYFSAKYQVGTNCRGTFPDPPKSQPSVSHKIISRSHDTKFLGHFRTFFLIILHGGFRCFSWFLNEMISLWVRGSEHISCPFSLHTART